MKTVGIITIHKIENYGSVLQAYALQRQCELLGYVVKVIDYQYPNEFQKAQPANIEPDSKITLKQKILKYLYAIQIILHNHRIRGFSKRHHNLTDRCYISPDDILNNPPKFDIYLTGSDQVWNSHFCKGDPTFLLHFAPDDANKVAYASSFGSSGFNDKYKDLYIKLLSRYSSLSVREAAGIQIISNLIHKGSKVVLDPTLLLGPSEWNKIATPRRVIKEKYILCYFLNYAFDAYPYVDELADHFQKITGYKIVRVGKPPKKIYGFNTKFVVEASPENFLALFRDAEMVLTTSFHGTAFSVNYSKPFISVVGSKDTTDSRVVDFLKLLNLESQQLVMNETLPVVEKIYYDVVRTQKTLNDLRKESIVYLSKSLEK